MNCNDERMSLRGKSDLAIIRQLSKERNDALKSRDKWIQAAFNLRSYKTDLFDELVKQELCVNCIKSFKHTTTKD